MSLLISKLKNVVIRSTCHKGEVRHELVAVHDDVGVAENDDHLLNDQQD